MIAKVAAEMAIADKNSFDFHHYRLHYMAVKNKLATLQDRLDNALKDDHTALRQLEKTLPLSEAAKKRLKNDKHPRNRK